MTGTRMGAAASACVGVAVGATDAVAVAQAEDLAGPLLTGVPDVHGSVAAAVTATLVDAWKLIPVRDRPSALLLIGAHDYSTWAVRRFAGRCDDTARRLRPSDSLGLETAELVRSFSPGDWRRACYLVAARPIDPALRLAAALAGSAHPATVLCDVTLLTPAVLDGPGAVVAAAVWTGGRRGDGSLRAPLPAPEGATAPAPDVGAGPCATPSPRGVVTNALLAALAGAPPPGGG